LSALEVFQTAGSLAVFFEMAVASTACWRWMNHLLEVKQTDESLGLRKTQSN